MKDPSIPNNFTRQWNFLQEWLEEEHGPLTDTILATYLAYTHIRDGIVPQWCTGIVNSVQCYVDQFNLPSPIGIATQTVAHCIGGNRKCGRVGDWIEFYEQSKTLS